MASIKLKPDRTLINSDFDGYKLSNCSDIVSTYSKTIPDGMFSLPKNISSESSSYLHTRIVSLHNHLFADPSTDPNDSHCIYCFNSRGQLQAFDYSKELLLCDGRVVWQTELSDTADVKPPTLQLENKLEKDKDSSKSMFGALPPTLVFADHTTAVASDGREKIFVIHTADRNPEQHHTWLTTFSASIGSCKILDARIVTSQSDNDPSSDLHILALTTTAPSALPVDVPTHLKSSSSLHIIYWLTLTSEDGNDYKISRERLYAVTSPLQYCQFDHSCQSIVLLTHQHCYILHDSQRPNLLEQLQQQKKDEVNKNPQFIFYQNAEDITLRLSTGENISSDNLRIVISSTQLTVSKRDDLSELVKETFSNNVDPETATWVIEGGTVEVTVGKAESSLNNNWSELFKDSELKGEEVVGEEQLQEMRDKLRHLTSENWDKGGIGDNPAYDPNQLEACDDADSDLLLLTVHGESDCSIKDIPKAMLGNTQYLATIYGSCGDPPSFCLRHDVDGLVYRIEESFNNASDQFTHTATFDAFGYVKASKTMAKYSSAPKDCSYAAVCDTTSRVYVFCQPLATTNRELKNRKTGKITMKVARQLLLTVPCHDEIFGIITLTNLIVVCTKEKVFGYELNLEEA